MRNPNSISPSLHNNGWYRVATEAIQNDALLNDLSKLLSDVYEDATPVIIDWGGNNFEMTYSDEVNELVADINTQMNIRINEIKSFYGWKEAEN